MRNWPLRPVTGCNKTGHSVTGRSVTGCSVTGHRGVIAVSGGADSTALLVALAALTELVPSELGLYGELTVVHVNHALRGEESDADALFVERTARRFALASCQVRLDAEELKRRIPLEGGLESAARAMRYEALIARAEELGARYIFTAHHRQDVLETLLQRLFRGSALSGLTGIAPLRPLNEAVVLVRPFLGVTRDDILRYLARKGQTYRVDSSNSSACFTRNRIRGELVPLLESIFPQKWDGALERLSSQAAELLPMIDERVDVLIEGLQYRRPIVVREGEVVLPIEALISGEICPSDYILRDLFRRLWTEQNWPLRDMSTRHWQILASMARGEENASAHFPGKVLVCRSGDTLTLTRR